MTSSDRLRRRLPVILGSFGLATSVQAQTTGQLRESIDRYMSDLAPRAAISGTLLVARGDTIVFHRAYGFANAETRTPNQLTTAYPIASPTKPMTGIMIRLLAERGALSLSDSIAKWLPDFPRGNQIRIEHLLTHRSGLPHRVTQPADELRPQTPASMVRLVAQRPLAFEPGARRAYSTAGYAVLARIAELVTGRAYHQLMREMVFAPAGATDSYDATDPVQDRNAPLGYFAVPDALVAVEPRNLSFLVGGGSYYATARDLFRVISAIRRGTYGNATAGAVTPDGGIEWNGFTNGFRSFVDYRRADHVAVIFVGNVLTGGVDLLRGDIPRLVRGEMVPRPAVPKPTRFELSTEAQLALEGPYDFFGNRQELRFVAPHLALLGTDYLLIAVGSDRFLGAMDYAELTVTRQPDGSITGLQYTLGATSFTIPRVGPTR